MLKATVREKLTLKYKMPETNQQVNFFLKMKTWTGFLQKSSYHFVSKQLLLLQLEKKALKIRYINQYDAVDK